MTTQPTSASNSNPTPASPVAPVAATEAKAASPAPIVDKAVATPAAEEMFEVQIDGKAEKRTRKELIEAYQLRQLSDKKRSEADKTLSEYNKMWEVFNADPIKFFKAAGKDFDKLATGYLSKKAEEAMMDPKEKELRDAKAKNEEYEKWVNEQKTAKQRAEAQQKINIERTKIHSEIVTAIEEAKDLGLPVDEELVMSIAQKMMLQDKKQKPLNAKEALPAAVASQQKFIAGIASKMDGAALINWLGKDVAMKIRKHDLSELKKKRGSNPAQPNSLIKPKTVENAEIKPKLWSAYKKELDEKYHH